MSTIAAALDQALRDNGAGHLTGQAGPVVAVLEQREAGIVSTVLAYAEQQGADMATINAFIEEQGLARPVVEETAPADGAGTADLEARVTALEAVVAEARRQGLRV